MLDNARLWIGLHCIQVLIVLSTSTVQQMVRVHISLYHRMSDLSNQIPCLITETSGPLLLLMTFIDKYWGNLGRSGLILKMCEYVCVDCLDVVYLSYVKVQVDSCAPHPCFLWAYK